MTLQGGNYGENNNGQPLIPKLEENYFDAHASPQLKSASKETINSNGTESTSATTSTNQNAVLQQNFDNQSICSSSIHTQ